MSVSSVASSQSPLDCARPLIGNASARKHSRKHNKTAAGISPESIHRLSESECGGGATAAYFKKTLFDMRCDMTLLCHRIRTASMADHYEGKGKYNARAPVFETPR